MLCYEMESDDEEEEEKDKEENDGEEENINYKWMIEAVTDLSKQDPNG